MKKDEIIKIQWIDKDKFVPGLGRMNTGDIRDVIAEIGWAMVEQGQAVAIRESIEPPKIKKSTGAPAKTKTKKRGK